MKGTIVTLGGGGFSLSDDGSSAIDDNLLQLTGADMPKVCFVPTASGDDVGYIERFEHAFAGRAQTSVLSLFAKTEHVDPRHVLDQHLVYVGGGSTANLLAVWRLHDLPRHLLAAAANGTVLAGISAGMNCWFEASSTDSFGALAPLRDGLGWLPGGACPHYLGESERRASLLTWVGAGELPDTYAVDDHSALVWRDGKLIEAITEAPGHPVYRVVREGDSAHETEISTRLLGT